MFRDNVVFLYCNFCFKLILIVLVLFGNFGNEEIVFVMLVWILIIFLWILSCCFFGVFISFWNVKCGVSSLYFNLFKLKNEGLGGNCILFIVV